MKFLLTTVGKHSLLLKYIDILAVLQIRGAHHLGPTGVLLDVCQQIG